MTVAVSVVVASRDAAGTLGRQLAALAAQRLAEPWEVVVVDDASTDGTASVVEGWAGAVPITLVRLTDRVGSGGARNAGVEVAAGSLLAFCDADDVVAPGWLAALVDAGRQHPLVGGRLDHTALNDRRRAGRRPALAADGLPVALGRWPYALGANLAVRRDLLAALGGFRPGPGGGSDVDLCVRAQLAHGVAPAWTPAAVVAYRHRAGWAGLAAQHVRWGRAARRLRRRLAVDHGPDVVRRTPPVDRAGRGSGRRPAHVVAGAAYATGWVVEAVGLSRRRRTTPAGRP